MPCNAHGHPPSCNCGWGGVFYAPSGAGEYGAGYWSREGSHTIPNARCPVCRASVFFYRSPDNGRVYFDSLGPPWPKHPCTDGGSRSTRSAASQARAHKKREGWWPFFCDSIVPLPDSMGSMLLDVDDRHLFTKQAPNLLSAETPIWIRPLDREKGAYEASTLRTKKGKTLEIRFNVFKDIAQLDGIHPSGTPPVLQGRSLGELDIRLKAGKKSRVANSKLQRAVPIEKQKLTLSKTVIGKAKPPPSPVKVDIKTKRAFLPKDPGNGKKIVLDKGLAIQGRGLKATQHSDAPPGSKPPLTAIQLAFSRLANTEDGQRALVELKNRGHG